MMRYRHRKEWDEKLLEAIISERMKPHIYLNKHCPDIQIWGITGNTIKEMRKGADTPTLSAEV